MVLSIVLWGHVSQNTLFMSPITTQVGTLIEMTDIPTPTQDHLDEREKNIPAQRWARHDRTLLQNLLPVLAQEIKAALNFPKKQSITEDSGPRHSASLLQLSFSEVANSFISCLSFLQ